MDEPGGTHPMDLRTTIPACRTQLEDREKGCERIGCFTDHLLDQEVLS
jgi:hypothetical protein